MAVQHEKMKFTGKELALYFMVGVLMCVGMLMTYSQGVNNGKVDLCLTLGLQYGQTTAGEACLNEKDVNSLLLPREKQFNLTHEDQWQIT